MFPTYTIGQVSKQLDVSCHTLRFWEKELGNILVPLRTNGGQRRYTAEHLDIVKEIKTLKDKGFTLAEIKAQMGPEESLAIVDRVAREIAEVVRAALNSFLERQST